MKEHKYIKFYGYYATKEEAIDQLNQYNKIKYDIDKKNWSFEDLYEEWSENHFKNISKSSVNGYRTAYKHCKNLYSIRFSDLKAVHLQRVIDEDCETYSIRKAVRVLLNCLFDYGIKNDIVEKKYSKYIDIGKEVTVYNKKIFTDEEVKILWDNVDKIDGVDTILELIYNGMRVTEFLEVENENVHIEDRYLTRRKKDRCRKK